MVPKNMISTNNCYYKKVLFPFFKNFNKYIMFNFFILKRVDIEGVLVVMET